MLLPRLSAAAEVIVTINLHNFPADALEPLQIEAHHPDEFIMHLFNLALGNCCGRRARSLVEPQETTKSVPDYPEASERPRTDADAGGMFSRRSVGKRLDCSKSR